MQAEKVLNKEFVENLREQFTRFGLVYKFALEEISTKVNILKDEFRLIHDYNPIEHVNTRIKSAESLIRKIQKKNIPFSLEAIKENIRDIAGIRIICSFVSDIYRISEMIQAQSDIEVVEVKDYIKNPKPNGYQSLHIVMKIPVFMSDRVERVFVEMQIRTIAMDFWASLEHKIYYKYNKQIPEHLTKQLKEAADTVAELDRKMEDINNEINILKENDKSSEMEALLLNPRDLLLKMIKNIDVTGNYDM
ncbi:GTP pyrophosphokinase family protein [Caldibacillus thermolactis]|jgi:putative GTP pyrophosphokinase|uniref:GTP pyrophosphokinase family protein n=1 Tax=Pallidibacillus thermolactis TaxID=251051 RepID=A0ABT2WCF5_9BACI|nr:GTP pyrophosphokinase family protein [Pallidibacillus thermolactis]MCU9593358.1 GTP pyrophosphokinase family protein [Pallidibacillus thermolactis]MCU9601527.1 GTP pyrophosphokinase family protein [Pallidibacillus thermolactis subsp. kokeshiiformis]